MCFHACRRDILLSRACSRLDRRHLYRNCRRDHRRSLGAGLHSALCSCDGPRLASRPRAVRKTSCRLGFRCLARIRHHVPGILGRAGAAHSVGRDVRPRVGARIGSDVVRLRGCAASARQTARRSCRPGARPRRARSSCSCFWCRRCSSFRTRISARAMPRAIVFIARISPPISSGTWR